MNFVLTTCVIVLHSLFWGAGLAYWLTPRGWQRYWPVFVPLCGLALQSTVVWLAMLLGYAGTNDYALISELLPAALLASAIWHRGRQMLSDLSRFRALGILMLVILGLTIWPFIVASPSLTTSSMGSCDAADYAAGARVLREFARQDRSGFIGLSEVVSLESVDNFFDHWVRLNHFAPSALIAHHAATFNWSSYEIISIFTAGLLALSLPVVFWLARAGLRHSERGAFLVTVLYGFSPLTLYAVYHVAIGQLLAAPAIALLTWIGIQTVRSGAKLDFRAGLGGLLVVAYALLLGSYHFIIAVCLAPAGAYVLWVAWQKKDLRLLVRSVVALGWPLLVASLLYFERVRGLAERASLFRQIDFGWKIPALTPEGWLGFVASRTLSPHDLWLRILLCLGLVALWIWTLRRNPGGNRPWRAVSLAMVAPVLCGYAYLQWRGAMLGTNASYDAYKLMSVFYPCMIGAFVLWIRLLEPLTIGSLRPLLYSGIAVVLAGNFFANASMWQRMCAPRLIVSPSLAALRDLETLSQVDSVNILTGDVWSRLWANALLIHKPQYFSQDTYEGRRATELKGRYDLEGRVCRYEPRNMITVGDKRAPFFLLQDTHAPGFLRVTALEGWYLLESDYRANEKARWTDTTATIEINNPSDRPQRVAAQLELSAIDDRSFEIILDGRTIVTCSATTSPQHWDTPTFELKPGRNILQLRSVTPATVLPGKDTRARALLVRRFAIVPADSPPPHHHMPPRGEHHKR